MIEELKADAKTRMNKSVEAFKQALTKIRTGRAHPSLLDQILVEYYGTEVPIKQVATVGVEDARTLTVTPWENAQIKVVEKAIMASELGLNPATTGNLIRIPLPPLTEERRRDLVKLVRQEGESAKIAIRNIRRDANSDLKEMLTEKMLSTDEERRGLETVQILTNQHVDQIVTLLDEKEKELMAL